MTLEIRQLSTQDTAFSAALDALLAVQGSDDTAVHTQVQAIIDGVRRGGDSALIEYTRRFDDLDAASVAALEISPARMTAALTALPAAERQALEYAAQRIRRYAERQRLEDWSYQESDGSRFGQQVTPMDRVGLYVPGGQASYPSSVLMNAIPAKVAGVPQLIMVTPTPHGAINPLVLAAAAVAGVDRAFAIGGAQAVAALAYGTATIPRVDKIVGPGNIYVATAKRLVFGAVGIDMIAGPSEVVIVSDGSADPEWIAMDLFAQAEHDENAQSLLLTPDRAHLAAVAAAIDKLLPGMERRAIIARSLAARGALIVTRNLDEAIEIANRLAPEHLELSIADPEPWLAKVRHAGAIFVGHYSAEVLGDYCAGPNHVLPTARTARFSSPLGVYDFQKRSSVINMSAAGAETLGRVAEILARGEGLTAHARSAQLRLSKHK